MYDRLGYPPDVVEQEKVFHLIARILRLMQKMKMRTQNNISQQDVKECARRLISETKNLHG